MKLRIDVAKLVDEYGGDAKMAKMMTEKGHPISRQAIQRARRDGSISMGFWLALCEIEMRKGHKLDLWVYVREGK